MSHSGATGLKATDKVSRDLERAARQIRPKRAIVRKTVAEYRRHAPSNEIDVMNPPSNLWDPPKPSTHTERVRRETWWICGVAIYSREIIDDSNL